MRAAASSSRHSAIRVFRETGLVMARKIKRVARTSNLSYPKTFRARQIATNGSKLYVRVGGSGPAVLLLHGYGETGDMWVPLAKDLAPDRTVVVPDLRGMGLSAKPAGGYDKRTQGGDIAGILDTLKIERAALVTHDIGNMVGYAFAAQYRNRVTRFVLIDAPLPGVGPWEEILKIRCYGISGSVAPIWSGSSLGVSAFTSTGSGTSSRPPQAGSARQPGGTTRGSTRAQAQCTRASRNSRPSIRTPPTTKRSWRQASLIRRFWHWAANDHSARPWRR